jgi:hypothetical protein
MLISRNQHASSDVYATRPEHPPRLMGETINAHQSQSACKLASDTNALSRYDPVASAS